MCGRVGTVEAGSDVPQVPECLDAADAGGIERHRVASHIDAEPGSIGGVDNIERVIPE
jgi:hypothetical protein